MPPRCQNRKIRSGSVALLRLSIFSMRNIQKIHAPIGKIFLEKHCHFSEFRIYWEVYRSSLPAPQAGELSSCTAASGGKQAGKAILPSPPAFLLFFSSAGIVFSVLSPLRIFALPALLSFRCLRFRHCCRTGFCTSPASLIGPIFPRFRLCHRHESRLFPALLSSRLLLLFGADICRYFLFSGIDSSPVPGSFFSAGVPFLDFRESCFDPFGFLRCRFFGLHPPVLSSYCPIF